LVSPAALYLDSSLARCGMHPRTRPVSNPTQRS
jgi:hypothetical protein